MSSSDSLKIKWNGPVFSTFSFGEVTRNYVIALDDLGVYVKILPVNEFGKSFNLGEDITKRLKRLKRRNIKDPYVNITFDRPLRAIHDPIAKKNISFFPFEHDQCDENWYSMNEVIDEYWVPSHYNYIGALKSGFDSSKLFIIPHGVDIERFNPSATPVEIYGKRGFSFLAISMYQYRKGWDLLIQAFTREFKSTDDVSLVCKTTHPKALYDATKPYLASGDAPPVIILKRQIDTDKMPGLYTAADCYILPVRAEGWGMPYLEAMASGVPTIGTRFSGNLEFMNDENSLLVELKELRPDRDNQMEGHSHNFAEPDISDLRNKMRFAYENRDYLNKIREKGLETAKRFTWIKQAKRIRERCNHLIGNSYYPDWKFELENFVQQRETKEYLLDVFILADSNTYLLTKALIAWNSIESEYRINLVDLSENGLQKDFIEEIRSKFLIHEYFRIEEFNSFAEIISLLVKSTSCLYIHLSSYANYPGADVDVSGLIAKLQSNPEIGAIGGYVVSPWQTVILGPFKQNKKTMDRSYCDKGIRSNYLSDSLKGFYESKAIHYQSMLIRRDIMEKGVPLPKEKAGFALSEYFSEVILNENKKIFIDGAFLIESQEIPGSFI